MLAACHIAPEGSPDSSRWVLSSWPRDGDRDVPRVEEFHIQFGRYLLPRSVNRGNVRLESGDVGELTYLRFDPVSQSVLMRVGEYYRLEGDTAYRLVVSDLEDLDGNRMPDEFAINFLTGAERAPPLEPPVVDWERVQSLLTRSCAGAGCHGADLPAAGLDLSSADGVRSTAVGAPARQSLAGSGGLQQSRGAAALVGLRIVDVSEGRGQPALSYLIYKVLGEEHILGDPMPPSGAPLSAEEVQLLSDWILAGAPTE